MNKPLTPEEAKNLTFPCLLEIWNQTRISMYDIVLGITAEYEFTSLSGANYANAALPSPEIAKAMRKQFAPESEYPKRMLVWNRHEEAALERIVLADLGEKANIRYITVNGEYESKFENEEEFDWFHFKNAKPIPDTKPIAKEIAELRQRLADLKAKHNQ